MSTNPEPIKGLIEVALILGQMYVYEKLGNISYVAPNTGRVMARGL